MINQTPNFHALLIGINFYFPHRLPEGYSYKNLGGCVRDINNVETYLKDPNTFNLAPEQIIKLTATASDDPTQPKEPPELLPTYENIVAKFKELTAKAQPQDQVYIHYSGHGGRAKTIFEDVKGFAGLDETLVPCDIGQLNSRYVRDLELAKLLEEMVEKELVVTVVFDSCHSGGVTRNESNDEIEDCAARGVSFIDMTERPKDSLVAPLEQLTQNWHNLVGNTRSITGSHGLFKNPVGYTLIAACRDNESAYEKVFEGSRERNGALTYFLLQSLRNSGTGISAQELYDRISNLVNKEFKQQIPMLIGETKRTFFGSQFVKTNPTIPVMNIDFNKNRIQLRMGEANGIKKGAEFEIFKFGTRDFNDSDQCIASGKVVEVGASDCWVEVTEIYNYRTISNKVQEGMIPIGSPAIYLEPGVQQIRKVRLLLPDSPTQISGINLSSLLTNIKEVKETVKGHRCIELCSEEEPDENINYFVSLNSAGEYWILDGKKERIKNIISPLNIDDPQSSEKLINRLIHITLYQNYLHIDNEDAFSNLKGKLKVELVKSVKPQPVVLNADGKIPVIKEGEENITFHIHNESPNQTLNITALLFAEDFSITQIYPENANYEVVEPGQEKIGKLELSLAENYEEGVNVIKVFATVYATNYRLLELPPLDHDLTGRKAKIVTSTSNEWTLENLKFVVVKNL